MENEAYKIRRFLQDVAASGAAEAIRLMQPKEDLVTQRKAYKFFSADDKKYGTNHGEAWVKDQVKRGLLHPKRLGKAVNSPVYYSKAELIQCKIQENALAKVIFKGTRL